MSILNINFCQKVCVQVPPSTCGFLPLVWTSSNPSSLTVSSSGNAAIISPVFGIVGTFFVVMSDSSGTMLTIDVIVTSPFETVVNPKYQYIYAGTVLNSFTPTQTTASVQGPFTGVIIPFQTNICTIFSPVTNVQTLESSYFEALSPNPRIGLTGIFSISPAQFDFVMLKATGNIQADPSLIFADTFTSSFIANPGGIPTLSTFKIPVNSDVCDLSKYVSIIQSTSNDSFFANPVLSSKFLQNGVIEILSIPTNSFAQFNFSGIVVPTPYINLSSNTLLYTTIVSVTRNAAGPFTSNFAIPNMSTTLGCWFAQPYGNDGLLFTVDSLTQSSNTNLVLNATGSGGTYPTTKQFVLVCYKRQNPLFNIFLP